MHTGVSGNFNEKQINFPFRLLFHNSMI